MRGLTEPAVCPAPPSIAPTFKEFRLYPSARLSLVPSFVSNTTQRGLNFLFWTLVIRLPFSAQIRIFVEYLLLPRNTELIFSSRNYRMVLLPSFVMHLCGYGFVQCPVRATYYSKPPADPDPTFLSLSQSLLPGNSHIYLACSRDHIHRFIPHRSIRSIRPFLVSRDFWKTHTRAPTTTAARETKKHCRASRIYSNITLPPTSRQHPITMGDTSKVTKQDETETPPPVGETTVERVNRFLGLPPNVPAHQTPDSTTETTSTGTAGAADPAGSSNAVPGLSFSDEHPINSPSTSLHGPRPEDETNDAASSLFSTGLSVRGRGRGWDATPGGHDLLTLFLHRSTQTLIRHWVMPMFRMFDSCLQLGKKGTHS